MLTVYAFSSENWNRDPFEINTLMSIFSKYAESFKTEALARNVRVKVLSTGALINTTLTSLKFLFLVLVLGGLIRV